MNGHMHRQLMALLLFIAVCILINTLALVVMRMDMVALLRDIYGCLGD